AFAVGDEKQAAAGFAGCFRQIDREREGVGAARAVEGDRDESADGGAGERVLLGRHLEAERVGSADGGAAVDVFAEKFEQLGAAQVAPAFGGGDPLAVAGQQEVGQANAGGGVGGSRLSGGGGGERHGESERCVAQNGGEWDRAHGAMETANGSRKPTRPCRSRSCARRNGVQLRRLHMRPAAPSLL